jgi:hypothetical protein
VGPVLVARVHEWRAHARRDPARAPSQGALGADLDAMTQMAQMPASSSSEEGHLRHLHHLRTNLRT